MADQPKTAVFSPIIPVGPRADLLKDQLFALHLSAAYRCKLDEEPVFAYPQNEQDIRKHLLPWNWKNTKDVVVIGTRKEGAKRRYEPFPANVESIDCPPAANSASVETLKLWVSTERSRITWDHLVLKEETKPPPADPEADRPELKDQLGYLSSFPGRIPGDLNLIVYFKIKDRQRNDPKDDFDITKIEHFIAAPAIQRGATRVQPDQIFKFMTVQKQGPPKVRAWIDGWPYSDEAAESAFVQPVSVKRTAGKPLEFNNEANQIQGDLGPDPKDYWVRSRLVRPWSDQLEQKCWDATDLFARSAEADLLTEHKEDSVRGMWTKLRLMAMAQFAQWKRPTSYPLPDPRATNTDKLLQALFDLPASVLDWTSDDLKHAVKSLQNVHGKLANNAEALTTWLSILRGHFPINDTVPRITNDPIASGRDLLGRAQQEPDFLDSLLLIQWDYAFTTNATNYPMMAQKWNDAKQTVTVRRLFGIRAQGESLDGLHPWAWWYQHDITSDALLDKITQSKRETDQDPAEHAKKHLEAQLKNLPDKIVHTPKVIPKILATYKLPKEWWKEEPPKQPPKSYVRRFIKKTWDGLIAKPKTEPRPTGFTLELDEVDREEATTFTDIRIWQNLAGVGLMVRENKDNAPWRVVSSAQVNLSGVRVRSVLVPEPNGPSPYIFAAFVSIERSALPGWRCVTIKYGDGGSNGSFKRLEERDAFAVLAVCRT